MTASPRVSVLMSVYNGARYLREAIDSILAQTFTDFEFIIVDDGSTDETPAILDSYTDPRIVRLRNETNIGLTKSLNRGLAIARGEYVARQDADDISLPERLAEQVRFLENHASVAALGSWFMSIDENGCRQNVIEYPISSDTIRECLLYQDCLCHGSTMIRRHHLLAVGAYREDIVLAQDWDLWLRLSESYELINLPKVLYMLRRRSDSLSEVYSHRQQRFGRQVVEEAVQRRLSQTAGIQPTPAALARHYLFLAGEDIAEGQRSKAHAHMEQAFAIDPGLLQDVDGILKSVVYRGVQEYSRRRHSADAADCGADYICHWFAELPLAARELSRQRRKVIGWYYVILAFHNYRDRCWSRVPYYAIRGIGYAPNWLCNRGLLSIVFRSLTRMVQCPRLA